MCANWSLPADVDLDGNVGVQGKLAKLKENDKKLKELAAWEKADATVGTVCATPASPHRPVVLRNTAQFDWWPCLQLAAQTVQPKLDSSHQVQVACMKKLYELNRLEMLIKESKKLAAIDV